jgi:ATP-dependent RNA helicase SUPV3L1/SUV3
MLKAKALALWQQAAGAEGAVADPMAPVIAPGGKATRWAIGGWARRRCGSIAPKRCCARPMRAGPRRAAAGPCARSRRGAAHRAEHARLCASAAAGRVSPAGARALGKGEAGPPAPVVWRWRAPRPRWPARRRRSGQPFAALAALVA